MSTQNVHLHNSVFQTRTGTTLSYSHYRPSQPKARVLVAHGVLEHRGRYQPMLNQLASQGFEILIMDQNGHGESARILGHLEYSLEQLAEQQNELLDSYQHDDLPIHIIGHSMGSMVACYLAQRQPKGLRSLSLCSPPKPSRLNSLARWLLLPQLWLEPTRQSLFWHHQAFGRFDRIHKDQPRPNTWLSRDPRVRLQALEDPLMSKLASISTLWHLAKGAGEVFARSKLSQLNKDLKVAVFYGEADPVGGCGQGPNEIGQRLAGLGHEVVVHAYPDARHELMHETNRQQFFAELLAFLQHS